MLRGREKLTHQAMGVGRMKPCQERIVNPFKKRNNQRNKLNLGFSTNTFRKNYRIYQEI